MEVKEVERVVITKPVASKPSCSSFKSFSELLAGAINASPSPGITRSENAVAAIRPKTFRAKPTVNRASTAMLSSQGEASDTAPLYSVDKVSNQPEGKKPSVLYKPLAKLVSKATVSFLATMGTPNITHQQALAQVEARAQHFNPQNMLHITNQHTLNQPIQQDEPLKRASETVDEEPKPFIAAANVDRPSYDGYNWRKYGQKQVKGSEYPRSYYKCTHPNCPVKKKVERTFDGQIAEIVYKGEHNHQKPQPPKRSSSAAEIDPKPSNNVNELMNLDRNLENCYPNKSQPLVSGNLDSFDCEEGSKGLEGLNDMPKNNKRRKSTNTSNEVVQDPRASVQNGTETEIVGDGFRWRKYGQKVVKGNPYPRSYYKCTSIKCNVRKYVERASEEPSAFLTTYEGKHNHDMPVKVASSAASKPDSNKKT